MLALVLVLVLALVLLLLLLLLLVLLSHDDVPLQVKSCVVTEDLGCRLETICSGDPSKRCLPHELRVAGGLTREACAASCGAASPTRYSDR